MIKMIATSDALDAFISETLRQAVGNTTLAQTAARRQLGRISEASLNQFSALTNLGRTAAAVSIDLHTAGIQLSQSVVNATLWMNHALMVWSAALYGYRVPDTAPAAPHRSHSSQRETISDDYGIEDAGDFVMDGLRFQPPLGVITSGLVDLADED